MRKTACLFAVLAASLGCEETKDDPRGRSDQGRVRFSLPVQATEPVMLFANTPVRFTQAFVVPSDLDWGTPVALEFDVAETLNHLDLQRMDGGTSGVDPVLTVRFGLVAGTQSETACDDAELAEVNILGDADFDELTTDTATVGIPPAGVEAAAEGEFSLCFESSVSVDAALTLSELFGSFAIEPPEDCAAPRQVAGEYSGTYACTDDCGGTEGGNITLRVLQAEHTGLYFDDLGAFYLGSVCSGSFSFFGGAMGYYESGTLTFTDEGATKTSQYHSVFSGCGGTCEDTLTLVPSNL
jgi:hypothetical protein